jgi:hypothetical protein
VVALASRAASIPLLKEVRVATLQLRPLSTGEILDGALTLLRRHFGLLFGIAVACEGVPTVVDLYFELASGGRVDPTAGLIVRILNGVGTLLVTGATVRAISEAYLGGIPRLGDALRYAVEKFGRVFGATFLSGLVTFLATLALVVPGIVVFCGYSVAGQVAALEPLGSSTDALRRSWALTKGFKGKALVLWLVSFALVLVVVIGAGALGAGAGAIAGGVDAAVTVLVSLVGLLIYPLITSVFTLFYYDLRVRKEGFDLEVLSGQLGSRQELRRA